MPVLRRAWHGQYAATYTSHMPKKALITGITGQDGSFLAEFLLAKGYQVHGIVRRASTFNTDRLDSIYADPHEQNAAMFLHYGDITDSSGLRHVIDKVRPQEIYNLGAQSREIGRASC